VDGGPEHVRIACAHLAVDAVGADEEVAVTQRVDVIDLGMKCDVHAEPARALLQDGEEALEREPAEAVASASDARALVVDVDRVPVRESARDGFVALRAGLLEVPVRLVRADDAPSERVVGRVPLDDSDRVRGIALREEDGEVEARRPAAQDVDAHVRRLTRAQGPIEALAHSPRAAWLIADGSSVNTTRSA